MRGCYSVLHTSKKSSRTKAQVLSIDAFVSIVLFLFLLLYVYGLLSAMDAKLVEQEQALLSYRTNYLADVLVLSSGNPLNWSATALTNTSLGIERVHAFGLSEGKSLSINKTQAFFGANASYAILKQHFGLTSHDFVVRLFLFNTTSLAYNQNAQLTLGVVGSDVTRSVSVARAVRYNNSLGLLVFEVYS